MYDVRWHAAALGAARALEVHATDHLGVAGVVTGGRLCPRCGSSAHGRPWLRVGRQTHHVSLSRSGEHLVTVVSDRPVGIDVEHAVSVADRWDPTLVLAPGEVATSDLDRARAWCRKEAVLKLRGTGLATPMTDVLLARERWRDLGAPAGHVAALSWGAPAGRST